MTQVPASGGRRIAGSSPLIIVADHASDVVPPGIDLGVHPEIMATHIAVDLGVDRLSLALSAALAAPALLGDVSRLVIDLNREPDSPGLIPASSDGILIPGNAAMPDAERARRIAAHHAPYHDTLSAMIDATNPALIVSVHSFTPALTSRDEPRPWPVGILYNEDDRAARIALPLLADAGLNPGDNQPYSGRHLNYTMDRHAEARGLPYLGIEVRQDGLADDAGMARWAAVLARVIVECLRVSARPGP